MKGTPALKAPGQGGGSWRDSAAALRSEQRVNGTREYPKRDSSDGSELNQSSRSPPPKTDSQMQASTIRMVPAFRAGHPQTSAIRSRPVKFIAPEGDPQSGRGFARTPQTSPAETFITSRPYVKRSPRGTGERESLRGTNVNVWRRQALGRAGTPAGRWSLVLLWLLAFVWVGLPGSAAAQTGALSEGWSVESGGPLMVDADLFTSPATMLGPSLSTGAAAGVSRGHLFAWQARASWSSATESSIAWTATHTEVRLRAGGLIQHRVGRARIALRLGIGPTLIHESRDRNQSSLQTTALAAVPAADLEGVIVVHVWNRWLLVMSGGPDGSWSGGTAHVGWVAQMGVGWQP